LVHAVVGVTNVAAGGGVAIGVADGATDVGGSTGTGFAGVTDGRAISVGNCVREAVGVAVRRPGTGD